MKVEYYDPNPFLSRFPMSNRIITENLSRNEKIDDSFNLTGIRNKLYIQNYIDTHKKEFLNELEGNMKFNIDSLLHFLNITHSSFLMWERLVSSVNSDFLLYTSRFGSIFDFYPIKKLLENGIKVVVGGQITTIQTPDQIRNYMRMIGCSDKHLENLLIVSGFVDLETNLFDIISGWEDFHIKNNNFKTFWQCENDYIYPHLNLLSKIPNANVVLNSKGWNETQVMTIFDDRCWWGKCRFCFMCDMTKNNFIDGVTPSIIAQNIINVCKKYKTNNVYITNDYFRFTEENEKILNILVENDINIGIYGGILFLKDKNYIDKLNKYISYLMIGLESCDNFALKYIEKGYKYEDIVVAINNLIKYCKRDIFISPCIINDLPYESSSDAIRNYTRVSELKEMMNQEGFSFKIKSRLLNIAWPNINRMIDKRYLLPCDHESKNVSGNYLIWKYFERLGLLSHDLYKLISQPFERYGSNGEIIKTDMDIIPSSVYEKIFK